MLQGILTQVPVLKNVCNDMFNFKREKNQLPLLSPCYVSLASVIIGINVNKRYMAERKAVSLDCFLFVG